MSEIKIIPFENKYAKDFKELNLEWLDKYNLTESHDLLVLNNPKETILDKGGCIFLAKAGDEIAGTAALMKEHDGVFELAKMAVTKKYQGKGISKFLLQQCLQEAKNLHAQKITLFSNHQLQTALKLYEQFGFRHIFVKDSPFLTADVKMELVLE
jgi:putative acetyltransferase